MALNCQFGRLPKSAGFRRNPQRHAGSGAIRQEKTPTENGWGFIIGGDGGDRTRVRKSSTVSSTYLVWPFGFNRCTADRQAAHWRVTLDLVPDQVTRSDTIPSK